MEKENNIIDLRRFWRAVRSLKWIYLIAAIAFTSAAAWYVCRSMPKVPIQGEILIGEESMDDAAGSTFAGKGGAGGMSQMMKTFSVGGFGAATVDNEIQILASHNVALRTVKRLNLNRLYYGRDSEGKRAMLYRNSPIIVEAPAEYFDTLAYAMTMKVELLPGGKADIKVQTGFFKKTIAEASEVTLPTMVKTPYGNLQVLRSDCFDSSPFRKITVKICGNNLAATSLEQELHIDVVTKLSDVVGIEIDYPNAELGKAIVNGIMAEYNGLRLDRIHETADNTIKYYDERIAETLSRLEKAEQKVADYQRENTLVSPASELGMLAKQGFEQQQAAIKAQNDLDYAQKVLSSLRSSLNEDQLIPVIESFNDETIVKYNELILDRRDLMRSAKPDNQALIVANEKIAALRDVIIDNAEKTIAKAREEIAFQAGMAGGAKAKTRLFPDLELELTVLARDQTFQTSLYQFLAQARENAVLKLYTNTDVGFIFQPAYAKKAGLPIKSIIIVLAAFIFAIFGVTVLALIVMWCSRKVKQPMDVAFMGFDNHTIVNAPDAAARMRTMLMADPARRVIFTAALGADAPLGAVIESFRDADIPVTEMSADSNSLLLSPEFNVSLAGILEQPGYVFVSIPEPRNLYELENAIDADSAALLLTVSTSMKRNRLKSILKGQTAEKLFCIISE